jgi:thymidylate synthase (FAD)
MTANLREWRDVFRQRCNIKAHPQMRDLMRELLIDLQQKLPII